MLFPQFFSKKRGGCDRTGKIIVSQLDSCNMFSELTFYKCERRVCFVFANGVVLISIKCMIRTEEHTYTYLL